MKNERLLATVKRHLSSSSYNRNELSGAVGDMGTFVPLTAAIIAINGMEAGPVLVFAGLFNITTGLLFGTPMCVQPMKAIAAIAIAENLTPTEIHGAGIFVGAFFLLMSLAGLVERLDWLIPTSVVRGLQLGIGLNLMMRGFAYVSGTGTVLGFDSITTGVLGGVFLLAFFFSSRIPAALVLFAAGVLLTIFSGAFAGDSFRLALSLPKAAIPSGSAFLSGITTAGLAQIPLTLLNSVIAVCALSRKLFPDMPAKTKTVSTSVGIMNIIGGFLGAMPMCHGAGGLAGQYRFGARTAGSMMVLGGAKLVLGVFAADTITGLMIGYPRSILGVLLIVSGMELSILVRDQKRKTPMFISLLTAAAILSIGTLAGFLAGLGAAYAIFKGYLKIEASFDPRDITAVYQNNEREEKQ